MKAIVKPKKIKSFGRRMTERLKCEFSKPCKAPLAELKKEADEFEQLMLARSITGNKR